MPKSIIRLLLLSAVFGLASTSYPSTSHAASTKDVQSQSSTIEAHFTPRPSEATRIDYDAWDFILSEAVLYMGPSTRTRIPGPNKLGSKILAHKSPNRLEGNKVIYSRLPDVMKSDIKAYADELIELGNRLDIPSLSEDEQLAYWLNLHHAVLISTISAHYPPPFRRPTLIKPIKGSKVKLHDAKLITIDGYGLSLRDVREKIVFPNWKDKDVPYAFHLGYLGSPNMPNYAYDASNLRNQLKINADEFVNSRRGYYRGQLNPYIQHVAAWYYPSGEQDIDLYFRDRMRPEIYAQYASRGADRSVREDLTLADLTGGTDTLLAIEPYLRERAAKFQLLYELDWFRNSIVTIEDTPTEDTQTYEETQGAYEEPQGGE